MKKKIALIPGHTDASEGATNYKGESEYDWSSRILKMAQKYITDFESIIITRDDIGIGGAVAKAKKLGCIAVYEQHFNWAATDPKTDIEYLADSRLKKSIKWAKFMAKEESILYPGFGLRRDEGCFKTTPKDRGGSNVAVAVAQGIEYSILSEIQFGNLKNEDSMATFEHDDKTAKFVGETINRFFKLEFGIA